MYKKLLSAAILGGFGFSSLSLNLAFAQNNSSSDTVKNKNKAKEMKPGLFTGRLCKKLTALNVSNNLFTTDTAIVLLLSFFSKIVVSAAKDYFFNKNEGTELNLEKVNKETNKYFESEVKRSNNAGKGFENKELKEENKAVLANKGIDKEKEIAKNLDEENKEKQEIKGAERSDVTNSEEIKNENTEKNDLSKKDNVEKEENLIGLKTKAFIILTLVGAIIFYKYLNRAVVEEKQEDGRIVYKIKVGKATKEDMENVKKKAKVGDEIVFFFNFAKTDNVWQKILEEMGNLLSTAPENLIPILNYDTAPKLHKIFIDEVETPCCFGNYNLKLKIDVVSDYSEAVNYLNNENLDSFEKFNETMLSVCSSVFDRVPIANYYNLSFSHIFNLVNTSYLLDFTYLRDAPNKYDDFLNSLLNKEKDYLKLEALTGFLYRDVLDEVEKKRKNEKDVNSSSARYKKISCTIDCEDLIDFIDVIQKFNTDKYKIKELKNTNINMNLVYSNLLEKILIYIFTNEETVAERKLYQSEKYEIFELFKTVRDGKGDFGSLETIDDKLEDDIFNKLKEFLERFKDNTKEYQAPAKFDGLTIEKLVEVYNKDYINNELDVFSGEFWELFKYVNNKNNEKNVGNINNRDKNLFNLISDLEDKLPVNSRVKLIIEKIYSGEMFKYFYYDDTVGEIYFNIKNNKNKIPLKDFVAAVEKTDILKQIFLEDKEYYEYKKVLHPLFLLLDVEAQKKDLIFLDKSEDYLGLICTQFNHIIYNPNLEKKVKNHFLKNTYKFSKYHGRYDENLENVKREAKESGLQEGSKDYNNYLLENVFKNREHKLPEKLDTISVDEFIETYEKYYIDDDLDVLSQEFWDIFIYVQDKTDEPMKVENKDEKQKSDLLNIFKKLLNKILENRQLFQEEILKILLHRDFAAVSFNAENNKIEIKIQNVKIPFVRFCEVAGIIIGSDEHLNEKDQKNTFFTAELLKVISYNKQNKRFHIFFTESEKRKTFEAYLGNDFEKFFGEYKNLSEDLKKFFEKQKEEYLNLFDLYKKNKDKVTKELSNKKVLKGSEKWNNYMLENVFKDEKENIENKEFKAGDEIINTDENQT